MCASLCVAAETETVGHHKGGKTVLPVNQVITLAGIHVELPGLHAQGLALSPDGKTLVVSGMKSELLALDPATGATKQTATPNV